jgi:hypothetical protein
MKVDPVLKLQVREILALVQKIAHGKSVELHIPNYSAIKCVSGSVHRRGTPPNVVEMSAHSLIELTQNPNLWEELCLKGEITASGTKASLKDIFEKMDKMLPRIK